MKSEDENLPHSEFRLKDWRNARFVFLGNKLTLALAEMYEAEFDLSQTEWRIIAAVAEHAPMSAKDLAEFIVIDIFSITRATSALVKRGLLTRRVNQQDRRKIELRLSARGRKVYDQIVPVALAVERAVFSGACQGTCRLSHAAKGCLSVACEAFVTTDSRSGLSVTAPMGVQSRVQPDQRAGLRSRAWTYTS